jgi:hypothetical protein
MLSSCFEAVPSNTPGSRRTKQNHGDACLACDTEVLLVFTAMEQPVAVASKHAGGNLNHAIR